jgi:dihydropteroate synthase
MAMHITTATHHLDFSTPLVMGILNTTPDSFSDGGQFTSLEAGMIQAREMIAQGAGIIDVGGESSRPGAESVGVEEEIRRTAPIIEALRAESDIPISIDTVKPAVAKAALEAGATLVNDISGGRDPEILTVSAAAGAGYILMHMRGNPLTMQNNENLDYEDVIAEINDYFVDRLAAATEAGISREALCLDPGIGFAKTVEQNFEILARCDEFLIHGLPILIGASRKSFIGKTCNTEPHERLPGSLAAATASVFKGMHILRVHDVAETVQAVAIARRIRSGK